MKPLFSVASLCLLAAVSSLAFQSDAQRASRGQVHALQATYDKGGEHPASTEISGPATITCINGASENMAGPQPSCSVTGPGFSGILNKGKAANLTGAGTVTLKCSGQGYRKCDARVDVPQQSK
jgi:hypothetical protein